MVRTSLPVAALLLLAACTASPTSVVATTPSSSPLHAACDLSWADLRARIPRQAHLAEVPDTEAFLERYNAVDPPTDTKAEHVFAARRGEAVILFFVTGGCVTDQTGLSAEVFAGLLGASL